MTRSRTKLVTPQRGLKPHNRRSQATPTSSSIDADKIADLRSQLARLHEREKILVASLEAIVEANGAGAGLPEDLYNAIEAARETLEQLA